MGQNSSTTYRILSGSALKVIALLAMVVDHVSKLMLYDKSWANHIWFSVGNLDVSLYYILVVFIGRMSFPLFTFLIGEGFAHTRNRRKYGLNLFLFALISEPAFDLLRTGRLLEFGSQNVFFTLFLGFLMLQVMESFKKNTFAKLVFMGAILCLAYFIRSDYGLKGVALVALLYVFGNKPEFQLVSIAAVFYRLPYQVGSLLSVVPMALYNGKRGFIKSKAAKYAFYAFYPLHLLLIWVLVR